MDVRHHVDKVQLGPKSCADSADEGNGDDEYDECALHIEAVGANISLISRSTAEPSMLVGGDASLPFEAETSSLMTS